MVHYALLWASGQPDRLIQLFKAKIKDSLKKENSTTEMILQFRNIWGANNLKGARELTQPFGIP